MKISVKTAAALLSVLLLGGGVIASVSDPPRSSGDIPTAGTEYGIQTSRNPETGSASAGVEVRGYIVNSPVSPVPSPTPTQPYIPPYFPPAPPASSPAPSAAPSTSPSPEPSHLPMSSPLPSEAPTPSSTPDDPGGDKKPHPPTPTTPGGWLEPKDDGSYIEHDKDGTPSGEWHWDPDDKEWVYEKYPQKSDPVKTGDTMLLHVFAAVAAASLLAIILLLFFEKHHRKN